jgi:hypothetical protein
MNDLINIWKFWNKKEKKWLKKGVSGFFIAQSFKVMDSRKLLMVLSAPSNINAYFMAGLSLYERGAIDVVTWAKHTSLFMFIEELEHGLRPTQTHYDAVFVRTKKGAAIAKRRAYEFLQEKGVSDISEHSYFTRGKWCDSILKDTEGNEMMLAEILVNYEKYLENTEWRTILKAKVELEEKEFKELFVEEQTVPLEKVDVEVKRKFTEWLTILK